MTCGYGFKHNPKSASELYRDHAEKHLPLVVAAWAKFMASAPTVKGPIRTVRAFSAMSRAISSAANPANPEGRS